MMIKAIVGFKQCSCFGLEIIQHTASWAHLKMVEKMGVEKTTPSQVEWINKDDYNFMCMIGIDIKVVVQPQKEKLKKCINPYMPQSESPQRSTKKKYLQVQGLQENPKMQRCLMT